jgi:taurine dioxygenase
MMVTASEQECKMIENTPTVTHPAVITHPYNGRKILFVNSIWTKRLLGMHMDLSEAVLNMLYEWVKKPEFMVRFRWEKDSVAMWDNCATQHYAVFDYAPHYRAGQRMTCGSFVPTLNPGAAVLRAASPRSCASCWTPPACKRPARASRRRWKRSSAPWKAWT